MQKHPDRPDMPKSLSPRKEFSFRLRNSTTIDEVISSFSRYFDKENRLGGFRRIIMRTYLSGRIKMLFAETVWGWKYVASVLLLYARPDGTWRVQIQGFARGGRLGALDKNLLAQIMNFFETQGSSLLQMGGDETNVEDEGAIAEQRPQAELGDAITCSACGIIQLVAGPRYCWNCGKRLAPIKVGGSLKRPTKGKAIPTVPLEGLSHGNCVVCRIALESGELLAWCPHCGVTAHRSHLLEWTNRKGRCPSCGKHLTVSELAQQLSEAHVQPTAEKLAEHPS